MSARLRFAAVPADRFVAQVRAIQARLDALPELAVQTMLADLETARQQVVREIFAHGDASGQLAALRGRLDDVMQRFVERYQAAVTPIQQSLAAAGADLAAQPLIEAGLSLYVPQLSRRHLEVAQDFQALLISNLADEATRAISRDLQAALLRGQSMYEAAQLVAGSLGEAATFGTIATRAEAITRTELGRIQSIATQGSLVEMQRHVPDLQKQWMHSGNAGRYRRTGHIAAGGQVRDVDQAFDVAEVRGGVLEPLLYPRDPSAPPNQTINCGCLSVPFRATWAAELEAAAAA